MTDEDPVAVDVSLAFFASVLVLFVFVVIVAARDTPPIEKPSTGQIQPTMDAVPSTWAPVPERTSFAVLTPDKLILLELDHFAKSIMSPLNSIATDTQFESATLLRREAAANAFVYKIEATADAIPPQWIRLEVPLRAQQPAIAPPPPAQDEDRETRCPISSADLSHFYRKFLTVFIMPGEGTDLGHFMAFAKDCGLRFRMVPLRPGRKGDNVLSIPFGLSAGQFALTHMLR
jgi:hypothetical protein